MHRFWPAEEGCPKKTGNRGQESEKIADEESNEMCYCAVLRSRVTILSNISWGEALNVKTIKDFAFKL